ncbi:MAG TPA: hypothetical protein VNR11_12200 [Xanthobacteraceae bacterium]|nr:hypothetical protein [Xanthobacteraceae bacterium]
MFQAQRQPSFALLLALAWMVIALQLMVQHWGATAVTLNDTDDAMRLVEMRGFLAGQSWFDLHQPRVMPPQGFDSHWSRLIDAGLAGLFGLFHLVVDAPLAERLMRALWPLLWLIPAMAGTSAIAWRVAGRDAAVASLLLVTLGLPAFSQFVPGRIDHHNAQIALALITIAATVWSDRVRLAASAAGVATGCAVAVGLEGLPFAALAGAAFALRFVADGAQADALRDYGVALAVGVAAAFAVSVAPAHWTASACDMIAINLALPAAAAGLGLALAAVRLARASANARAGAVVATGALALALFAALEPRCLRGPFAMMDPAVWPIWLAQVNEMQPLGQVFRKDLLTALWLAAYPALGLVALAVLVLDDARRRDAAFLTAAAALVVAMATTLATVKGAPYAIWFAIPPVAALAIALFARFALDSLLARFAVVMLLTPTAVSGAAAALAVALGQESPATREHAARSACFASASYSQLAQLPPGLVAANVDDGPFLLALTPHTVLAAPYHRAAAGILAAHDVFAAPPDVARDLLAGLKADYVAICGERPPARLDAARQAASLWGRLQAGEIPPWLEPVPQTQEGPIRVFRIRAAKSAAANAVPALADALRRLANVP